MKQFKRLVAEFAPHGAPVVPLGDPRVATFKTGTQLNRSTLGKSGQFPVINGGTAPSGYHDQANTDGPAITISQGGASAGYVSWIEGSFWAGAHCYVVTEGEGVDRRFLFYALKWLEPTLQGAASGAGIPGLSRKSLGSLSIPIPPLPIQHEIVGVLDQFVQLEAELEAELEARRSQYSYYLGRALANPRGPVVVQSLRRLEESGVVKMGRGKVISKTDLAADPGDYPVYSSSGVGSGEFGRYGKFMFDDERITWSVDGGGRFFYRSPHRYSVTNVCGWMTVDNSLVRTRYLYYALTNQWADETFDYTRKAHPSVIRDVYQLPIPAVEEQDRIIDFLDSFDTLVNDLSIGLPAELAARRKQYEYYRDKLLTFEEAPA